MEKKKIKSKEKITKDIKKIPFPYFKIDDTIKDKRKKGGDKADKDDLVEIPGTTALDKLKKVFPETLQENKKQADNTYKAEKITSALIKDLEVPFFFSSYIKGDHMFQPYYLHCRDLIRAAFGMKKNEHHLHLIINEIDQPTPDYIFKIPRYQKLQRLKAFNDILVDFFLQLLHNYYWVDFATQQSNTEPLNYYVARVIPICQNLYSMLIAELDYEFPKDEYELKY